VNIGIMPAFFENISFFLKAAIVTVYLSLVSLTIATLIGIVLGVVSVVGGKLLKAFVLAYVYVLRGLPILVLLFVFYYTLPAFRIYIPSVLAAIAGLSLWTGAYMTEIFRGAILALPRGQIDAGNSLGMDVITLMRQVVLPQSLKYAIPPSINMTVRLIKGTSVVSIINIWELTYAGRQVTETTLAPFQVFGGIAIIYFLFCYSLSYLGAVLEKRYTYIH